VTAPRDPFAILSPEARRRARTERLPDWTPPMLATLTQDRFSDPAWVFERKFDGERCLVFGAAPQRPKEPGRVTLKSRNRNDITAAYPELAEAIAEASSRSPIGATDFIADGEIVAFDGDRTSFQLLQRRIHLRAPGGAVRARVPVYIYLFDLLHLAGHDVTSVPLVDRKRLLEAAFRWSDVVRLSEHHPEEGERLYAEACRQGWEGLIAKRAAAPYQHARSKDWLKFKCEAGQELVVGGFTDPKGSRVGFGALLLGVYEGDRLVYAGKVGTGFDTRTLRDLDAKLRALERDASPFATAGIAVRDAQGARVHWIEPELVAQIGFSEWTADGHLRHPRFLGLRDDKDPRSVVRERPT
jgi:DNA ligase D-like protein (predicted ligase)